MLWLDVGQEYGTAIDGDKDKLLVLWLDVGQEYGTAIDGDKDKLLVLWLDVGQEYGTSTWVTDCKSASCGLMWE